MLAVPMIDGEIEKGQIEPERVKAKNSHRYDKLISNLFPEDDWFRDNCKTHDAKQSVLFFKEAKQMEDGNWEVKPFTMFLNPDSTLAESLEADQPGVKKTSPSSFEPTRERTLNLKMAVLLIPPVANSRVHECQGKSL